MPLPFLHLGCVSDASPNPAPLGCVSDASPLNRSGCVSDASPFFVSCGLSCTALAFYYYFCCNRSALSCVQVLTLRRFCMILHACLWIRVVPVSQPSLPNPVLMGPVSKFALHFFSECQFFRVQSCPGHSVFHREIIIPRDTACFMLLVHIYCISILID